MLELLMKQKFNDQHIQLLTHAFENDPMFDTLFKGINKHRQMKAMFNFIYKRNQLMQGIYLTDSEENPSYVAFIEKPKNQHKVALINVFRLIVEMFKLVFNIPIESLIYLSQYDAITTRNRPRENHYYLTMIGISVTKLGQGIGREVINKIHQIVINDKEVTMICLDTENKNNVTYYQQFGYKLIKEINVKDLQIYCMTLKKI